MTNIDLCGIARLLRTLVEQKKTTEREALFSIAISKVLWYCLCCKKGGELTWRKS